MKVRFKLLILILVIGFICVIQYKVSNIRRESFVKLIINEQEIFISKDTEEEFFDLQTLNSEYDTNIKIQVKNAKVKIQEKEINSDEEIILNKVEISHENKIEVSVKLFGDLLYKKIKINTLPDKFPEYEFKGSTEENGDYYVTTYQIAENKAHYIYKLDKVGNVIFYRETPDVCYNFKKNVCDDQTRYTYLEAFGPKGEGVTLSLSTKLMVLNEKYELIDEIYYLNKENSETQESKRLDNHDYLYLSDNHYIIVGFIKETVEDFPQYMGEPIEIWNCKIQEVLDEEVIWEFETVKEKRLYDCYDMKNLRMMRTEPVLDYVHFNSLKIDPVDGNLICSFRNLDAIVKIDRKTGKILWILGGIADQFGLQENQKFSKQHSISFLSDNSILVYDNGNARKKSRVIIIKIDEENKNVEKYESYELGIYSSRMGAVQVVNEEKGIYLVTYGVGQLKYGFEEINLKTLEPNISVSLSPTNNLYCVNKY